MRDAEIQYVSVKHVVIKYVNAAAARGDVRDNDITGLIFTQKVSLLCPARRWISAQQTIYVPSMNTDMHTLLQHK